MWLYLHIDFGVHVRSRFQHGGAFLLWGGVAFSLSFFSGAALASLGRGALPVSSVEWCCLPSPPSGGGAFLPAPFALVFFLFLGTQPYPGEAKEGSTTKRRRRPNSPTRKGGEGKQHH